MKYMKWLTVDVVVFAILFLPSVGMSASVRLTWDAPTSKCDLTPLTDLAGYVVMWGQNSGGPYTNWHDVDDALATSEMVDLGDVSNMTLYFAVASVSTSGDRSDDPGGCGVSNEVTVTFPKILPLPPTGVVVVVQ